MRSVAMPRPASSAASVTNRLPGPVSSPPSPCSSSTTGIAADAAGPALDPAVVAESALLSPAGMVSTPGTV